MDRSINILAKTLSVVGFHLFGSVSRTAKFGALIRLAILIGCEFTTMCMFIWEILYDPILPIGDKIFMTNISIVFGSMIIQVMVILTNRDGIVEIFGQLTTLSQRRPNKLVQEFGGPLYEKCAVILYKISRVQLYMAIANLIGVSATPMLSKTVYIYPMEFPIVVGHERVNYLCNFSIQMIGGGFICIFFGFFSLIFIISTVGIMYELQLVAELCGTVGEDKTATSSKPLLKLIINIHLNALKF